ncbi:uncharacterized protein LOC129747339 isoform X2 [Uranotaenia lowii]|uniref:uncharacterized protein LOC129747339 isoform X2 n=1 Tax=Uranotaenia lowii TaxID=190385 RepID=UPI0024796AB1|nr:uncharacterized protein LOC129747339 isoform X2 [Uranotaenia lowii]
MNDDVDGNLLMEVGNCLSQFDSNVSALLQILNHVTSETAEYRLLQDDIRRLESASQIMCTSLDRTFTIISTVVNDITDKTDENQRLKVQLRNADQKLNSQERRIAELESQQATIKHQALGQFESVSWIGCTMGALLWKLCKNHDSVKSTIGTDCLRDFLGLANCVLSSFVARQSSGLQISPETDDYNFLASICGVLTNVAAFPEGRVHLSGETDGLLLVNSLLHAMDLFQMPGGRVLKRMSLTFVYNICLEENGARFVMSDENRLKNVIKCLNPTNTEDILALSIGLLIRLIKSAPDYRERAEISHKIPKAIVKQIVRINNQQLKETAEHLVELIEYDWVEAAIRKMKQSI